MTSQGVCVWGGLRLGIGSGRHSDALQLLMGDVDVHTRASEQLWEGGRWNVTWLGPARKRGSGYRCDGGSLTFGETRLARGFVGTFQLDLGDSHGQHTREAS